MARCDVVVVGGGPAGSSCARSLIQAGRDVVVLDKAEFPRDKVCTGWITPQVVRALQLDLADYGRSRTVQTFTGFRTGPVDGRLLLTDFHRVVSYGIRRYEFDDYLLRRSGARLMLGQPLRDLRRDGSDWVVNESLRAPMIVGAGGHFCRVARHVNAGVPREAAVVAQEIEYPLDPKVAEACGVHGEWPELFFWPDLLGYGWCVRKGNYLNVGVGHLKEAGFAARAREFSRRLQARGVVPEALAGRWKGHAYLLNRTSSRRVTDEGVLLVGDAAGLALAPSGEGILAAVESGLMAAETILAAAPHYSRERLRGYADRIDARFGPRSEGRSRIGLPEWLMRLASRVLLSSPPLTRHVLLERAFLHVDRAAYAPAMDAHVAS